MRSSVCLLKAKRNIRPGTEVGVRDRKVGVVYDIADPSKRRQLPQHDFSEAKVNQKLIKLLCRLLFQLTC